MRQMISAMARRQSRDCRYKYDLSVPERPFRNIRAPVVEPERLRRHSGGDVKCTTTNPAGIKRGARSRPEDGPDAYQAALSTLGAICTFSEVSCNLYPRPHTVSM